MKKTTTVLSFLLVLLLGCSGQTAKEKIKIYNKDFKWTITIPEGFDTVNAEVWTKMQRRGTEAIEKNYEGKIENNAKTIFVFQNSQFNYFESNYQPFDTLKDGNYLKSFRDVNNILYGTFQAEMKGAKLDSTSSTAIISGITFQTFNVIISFPNKMEINWHMYSRLFGKKEFTVNIMTVDKDKEKELLNSWLNSKFDK